MAADDLRPDIVIYFDKISSFLSVVVGGSVVSSGAGAHFPQLRLGVTVFRHPGDPLPHRPAAVFRCAVVVLHDAPIIWNDGTARGDRQGAGRWSSIVDSAAAALSGHRAGATDGRSPGSCGWLVTVVGTDAGGVLMRRIARRCLWGLFRRSRPASSRLARDEATVDLKIGWQRPRLPAAAWIRFTVCR